jgi:small subunit ribosomal protein S2
MTTIDKMFSEGTFTNLSKREKLQITRQRAKLEKTLGSIADLNRLPAALFVVDVQKEYIAVREAKKLNIPVFAMVDTCCDPTLIDFVIPANDDAAKSIYLVVDIMSKAIQEGIEERKMEKDKEPTDREEETEGEERPTRTRARKSARAKKIADSNKEGQPENAEKPKAAKSKVIKKAAPKKDDISPEEGVND